MSKKHDRNRRRQHRGRHRRIHHGAPKVIVGNQAYNAIIAAVVAEFTAHGLPVTLLDRYANFDPATESADYWGHPNDSWQRDFSKEFLAEWIGVS